MVLEAESARHTGPAPVPRLTPAVLRPLRGIHPLRSCRMVALEWVTILGAAALSEWFRHPLSYVLTIVWIGSRQHALFLLAHEGAHGLLHPDRRWNERISELFCAWPVLIPFRSYRSIHRLHHRHLNSERDPDWARNRPDRLRNSRGPLDSLSVLLGLDGGQSKLLVFFIVGDSDGLRRLIYYSVALAVIGLSNGLPLLVYYWLIPLFTWFIASMRLKGTAEHLALPEGASSRTLLPRRLEALLIAPNNVGYHAAHHAYPNVPFYNLPELHRKLMELDAFREAAHVTHGYLAFLGEWFSSGSSPTPRMPRSDLQRA